MTVDRAVVADVKARAGLVGLVAKDGVKLARAGRQGRYVGLCPFHGERTGSFHVDDRGFRCYGCGARGDVIDYLRLSRGMTFRAAMDFLRGGEGLPVARQAPAPARRSRGGAPRERAWKLWRSTRPLAGSAAETYLREARGIDLERLGHPPGGLRALAGHDYWRPPIKGEPDDKPILMGCFPAMVAALCDRERRFLGVQVTWLQAGGAGKVKLVRPDGKALPARKIVGQMRHAGVRLTAAGLTLQVAEGVENALTATTLNGVGAHAAVSKGNLAGEAADDGERLPDGRVLPGLRPDMARPGWLPPRGVRRVVIVADNDEEDPRFAEACYVRASRRLLALGYEVAVAWPEPGTDLNDMVMGDAR